MSVFINGVSKSARISTGTYSGDNTQNRGILHGLGKSPKEIIFIQNGAGGMIPYQLSQSGDTVWTNDSSTDIYQATQGDSTKYYVGKAVGANGNVGGITYNWVGIS